MRITIQTIDHKSQRYNTVGDWVFDQDGGITIFISETGRDQWNICIAIHELVEAFLCKTNGITQEQVDKFDMGWKPNDGFEEPGEDPRAPYFNEHSYASYVEHGLFDYIHNDDYNGEFGKYEAKLEELMQSRK
jgi:hypothetical protein